MIGKRMGGVVGSLLLVLTVALTLVGLPRTSNADTAGFRWTAMPIQFNTKTTTVLTGTARDTQFVTSSADSFRTQPIDTGQWAWDALAGEGVPTAAGPITIGFLNLTATTSNGATDTLYYNIEKLIPAGPNGSPVATWTRNNTLASGISAQALLYGVDNGAAMFQGLLNWAPGSTPLINQIHPGDIFRLVVHGDQSGTTPKLSGVRITLTAPIRQASR